MSAEQQASRQFAANTGMQQAQAETNRLLAALGLGQQQGALERQVGWTDANGNYVAGTDQTDAAQQEKMRQQALFENSIYGPLGMFGSTAMSTTTGK